ncbi:MAG: hypothetical protein HKN25_05915 [Pyrinomonadaceae bacterium]|nr:hypothetical protein [Pyrinomonadaceae bacterium]
MERLAILFIALITGPLFVGCGSGLPELRPGLFTKPVKIINHGRIVEKRYRFQNGPSTVNYAILEIDGKPLRIPNGAVEFTSYCEVAGIEAIGFTVRGKGEKAAGVYILQLDGDKQIFERLCDYTGSVGSWKEAIFIPPCKTNWDAKKRSRINWR